MSKCLIDGHKPIQREGVGEYLGKQYLVCSECAMTLGQVVDLNNVAEAVAEALAGPVITGYEMRGTIPWPRMREYES